MKKDWIFNFGENFGAVKRELGEVDFGVIFWKSREVKTGFWVFRISFCPLEKEEITGSGHH